MKDDDDDANTCNICAVYARSIIKALGEDKPHVRQAWREHIEGEHGICPDCERPLGDCECEDRRNNV